MLADIQVEFLERIGCHSLMFYSASFASVSFPFASSAFFTSIWTGENAASMMHPLMKDYGTSTDSIKDESSRISLGEFQNIAKEALHLDLIT